MKSVGNTRDVCARGAVSAALPEEERRGERMGKEGMDETKVGWCDGCCVEVSFLRSCTLDVHRHLHALENGVDGRVSVWMMEG